jgi:hypothetical protein
MNEEQVWKFYAERFWTPCQHVRQCVGLCALCLEQTVKMYENFVPQVVSIGCPGNTSNTR